MCAGSLQKCCRVGSLFGRLPCALALRSLLTRRTDWHGSTPDPTSLEDYWMIFCLPKIFLLGWTAQSGQTPNAKRTPNLIKHILHQSTTFLLTVSMNILTFCHGVQFWPIFRRLSRKSNWPNVANVCPGNRIGQTSIIHSVWGDENYCTAIDVTTDPPRCSNSPPFTEKQCSL